VKNLATPVKRHHAENSVTTTTMTSLQQVLVDFEAVVAGVGNDDTAVISYCKALWAVQRVSRRVDERQERAFSIKHLRQTALATSSHELRVNQS